MSCIHHHIPAECYKKRLRAPIPKLRCFEMNVVIWVSMQHVGPTHVRKWNQCSFHGGAIKPCIVKPAAEMTRRLDGNGVFGRCVKRVPDFSDLWDYSMHIPNVRRGSYSEAVHIGQIRPPYCYQKAALKLSKSLNGYSRPRKCWTTIVVHEANGIPFKLWTTILVLTV